MYRSIFKVVGVAAVATVLCIGCYNNPADPVDKVDPPVDPVDGMIEGLTMENYPRVDGSTSTDPLNIVIAAKLLGLEYEWGEPDPMLVKSIKFKNRTQLPTDFMEKIKCSQTHNAIVNLIDNKTDLIISARKMSPDEKRYADSVNVLLIETPIALDALDFIINSQNSVNSLRVEEIQDIYLGNITNWKDVGGADTTIRPYIRNTNSGSQEMMNEIVMKNTGMPDWEALFPGEDIIISMFIVYAELLLNEYGISFTPHYYKEYMVENMYAIKTLAINAVAPDSNSIKNKTYPFVANVYVSIRSDLDRNSMAYKLYQWLQTEAGKRVIRESGYVPN